MLKFENVTKSFKDGNRNIEAVKDTNFEINKGDIIALVDLLALVKVHF